MSSIAAGHGASIEVGAVLEPKVVGPLSRTDIVIYQGASGDFQPIHHDEPFARSAGFDKPLVVGMLPAGVLTGWAADIFGPDLVRRVRVRFRAPVWPGDTLRCEGYVERIFTEGDEPRFEVALRAVKEDGAEVIKGSMVFVRGAL